MLALSNTLSLASPALTQWELAHFLLLPRQKTCVLIFSLLSTPARRRGVMSSLLSSTVLDHPLCFRVIRREGMAWHSGHKPWLPGGRNGGVSLSLPPWGSWNVMSPSLCGCRSSPAGLRAGYEGRRAVYSEGSPFSAHSTRLRNGLMFLALSPGFEKQKSDYRVPSGLLGDRQVAS